MKNKIIALFIMVAMLITLIPQNVFAAYAGMDHAMNVGDTDAIRSSQQMINRMFGTFQVAGTIIAVIALIIIGMRYMFSSVQDRAAMKGVMGYYIAGAILVLATSNVVKFAYDIINGL